MLDGFSIAGVKAPYRLRCSTHSKCSTIAYPSSSLVSQLRTFEFSNSLTTSLPQTGFSNKTIVCIFFFWQKKLCHSILNLDLSQDFLNESVSALMEVISNVAVRPPPEQRRDSFLKTLKYRSLGLWSIDRFLFPFCCNTRFSNTDPPFFGIRLDPDHQTPSLGDYPDLTPFIALYIK